MTRDLGVLPIYIGTVNLSIKNKSDTEGIFNRSAIIPTKNK